MGSPATPHLQVGKGSRDLILKFSDPSIWSGTVRARNAKFCIQIHHQGYERKKCKIGSKWVRKRSRDLILKFWDPSISRERLELETPNFACRLITRGANERNVKLGQRGVERVTTYVAYF